MQIDPAIHFNHDMTAVRWNNLLDEPTELLIVPEHRFQELCPTAKFMQ
jgi:hypothetical protein